MAKNIIFLIVDSVYQQRLKEMSYRHSPTPFLNSLRGSGMALDHMYSQAPFTEAALSAILCGVDLMDGGGYIQRLKYKHTVMEEFQKHGYETFANHYAPQSYPSTMFPGVGTIFHQSFYIFKEFWDYRYIYYTDFFLGGLLCEDELSMIKDMMAENLEAWITQLRLLINRDPQVQILIENSKLIGISEELLAVTEQYKLFMKAPIPYLKKLFEEQYDHILLRIPIRKCDNRVPFAVQMKVRKRYLNVFDLIERTNRVHNKRNLPPPISMAAKCLIHGDLASAKQYAKMYRDAVWDPDLYERIGSNYTTFRASMPCRSYFEHFLKWLDERPQPQQPLFTYLHVDDAHTPETFFTSDSSDFALLDREFGDIKNYIADLPKNYRGSLTCDLSLLYVDNCIKYLFEGLDRRNVLEDTAVVIMADHGFSFSYDPIRKVYVNNFNLENYNPPFIIYDRGQQGCENSGVYMEKDIAPTLLELCGLPIPESMTGRSILSFPGRDHTLIEYMGEGCPDMRHRPTVLGVRTKCYLVVVEAYMQKPFDSCKIVEVYNLQKDPMEHENIVKTIPPKAIEQEFEILRERFERLLLDYKTKPNAFNTSAVFEKRPNYNLK